MLQHEKTRSGHGIRDASTILLVRPAEGGGYLLYSLRRSKQLKAFAGVWAFPGGSVDPQDRLHEWDDLLAPLNAELATQMAAFRERSTPAIETQEFRNRMRSSIEKRLGEPLPEDPIPDPYADRQANFHVWVAAFRELFEETGVLLVRESENLPHPDKLNEARRLIRTGELRFIDFLKEYHLFPKTEALRYMGRLLTPSTEPRRYDTRFFLARLSEDDRLIGVSGAREEADRDGWFSPVEMLSSPDKYPIIPPTRYAIEVIASYDAIDRLWDAFAYRSAL